MNIFFEIIIWVSIPSFVRLFKETIFIPIQNYKKILWEIMLLFDYNKADFYNDRLNNEEIKVLSSKIKKLRWELKVKYMMIPLKKVTKHLLNKINWDKIEEVCGYLTYLSNIVWNSCEITKKTREPIHKNVLCNIDKINKILWFNISQKDK